MSVQVDSLGYLYQSDYSERALSFSWRNF